MDAAGKDAVDVQWRHGRIGDSLDLQWILIRLWLSHVRFGSEFIQAKIWLQVLSSLRATTVSGQEMA